ncbi:MAG TPA: hypothetical protein VJN62_05415 [Gemmatimonadales bacterium]|nr:hypothetical protein [Gemmatimonadales bacterium]
MKTRYLLLLPAALTACDAPRTATGPALQLKATAAARSAPPAPAPLTTLNLGGESRILWPYLNSDLSSAPEDPVSLVFRGGAAAADPRSIRAALVKLDGDRSAFGFPNVPPFNCTWSDAIGDVQAAFTEENGWVGSAIQLGCGDFGPMRFHVRLFGMGNGWTIGGAHFEVLIPGTTTHQVLSWELAEQLVTVDLLRTGLLDAANPIGDTGPINASPFRTIPAVIYNGLPGDLRAVIGGPAADQTADVPIQTDGHATVFNVAAAAQQTAGTALQDFTIQFNQVIPKPFCASGPADFVLVQGPVHLTETIQTTATDYNTQFHATGKLTVTPVDPTTGSVTGAPFSATVQQEQASAFSDTGASASEKLLQTLVPTGGPTSQLKTVLDVVTGGKATANATVKCGS